MGTERFPQCTFPKLNRAKYKLNIHKVPYFILHSASSFKLNRANAM